MATKLWTFLLQHRRVRPTLEGANSCFWGVFGQPLVSSPKKGLGSVSNLPVELAVIGVLDLIAGNKVLGSDWGKGIPEKKTPKQNLVQSQNRGVLGTSRSTFQFALGT